MANPNGRPPVELTPAARAALSELRALATARTALVRQIDAAASRALSEGATLTAVAAAAGMSISGARTRYAVDAIDAVAS